MTYTFVREKINIALITSFDEEKSKFIKALAGDFLAKINYSPYWLASKQVKGEPETHNVGIQL